MADEKDFLDLEGLGIFKECLQEYFGNDIDINPEFVNKYVERFPSKIYPYKIKPGKIYKASYVIIDSEDTLPKYGDVNITYLIKTDVEKTYNKYAWSENDKAYSKKSTGFKIDNLKTEKIKYVNGPIPSYKNASFDTIYIYKTNDNKYQIAFKEVDKTDMTYLGDHVPYATPYITDLDEAKLTHILNDSNVVTKYYVGLCFDLIGKSYDRTYNYPISDVENPPLYIYTKNIITADTSIIKALIISYKNSLEYSELIDSRTNKVLLTKGIEDTDPINLRLDLLSGYKLDWFYYAPDSSGFLAYKGMGTYFISVGRVGTIPTIVSQFSNGTSGISVTGKATAQTLTEESENLIIKKTTTTGRLFVTLTEIHNNVGYNLDIDNTLYAEREFIIF